MWKNYIWGIAKTYIRQALLLAGAGLVAKGLIDQSQLVSLVGVIMGLISSGWSAMNAKQGVDAEKDVETVKVITQIAEAQKASDAIVDVPVQVSPEKVVTVKKPAKKATVKKNWQSGKRS